MAKAEAAIQAAWKAIDEEREYATELTQKMVRVPTVNPKFVLDADQNKEAVLQDLVQSELESIGMSVERWDVFPDRPNVVAQTSGSEERSLLLCGHIDTVPIGERETWTVDPFGGEIRNGRLYGRGAVDMKSGVAAAIGAVRGIRKAGIDLNGRVAIHSVVDEEAGGFGAMDAVRRGHLAKAAIVTEPSWGEIQVCEGGLEWIRITITGRQGHSAWRYNELWPQRDGPERLRPAVNAIDIAARFLSALKDFESSRCRNRQHPLLPPGMNTINVGAMRAGSGLGPDGLPLIMTNPAIIPDVAVIDLDYKFLPNQTKEFIRREFEEFVHHFCQQDLWLRDNPIKVEWELGGLHFPPMDTSPDHPIVKSLMSRRAQLGGKPKISGVVFVADCAHYAGAGVDAVICGASGDGFHGLDEYVDIASLEETTKTLAASIIDWCGIR
ncbi:ArgE/DapE family deacylase [Mesorhizobium sp.]|uniref:M20 family metallopeptidase n=1 Tax=Mesorhizobium sp. TaxID=1871066 RepID=UPI000FE99562|nr:ArgE/DapE family deacylase [Mesorhizobium sp.]RWG00849.1 MAG: ArgE/DapE family deacylase [Mesorhizobium sp.]RWG96593.1 MAG: ArgE/DapE family deacylase [Mesorhizobium sp.]TIR91646.1 MAG: ArgE/DapE family deacylase [Mesorhizobium sp.]TIS04497.1 MAG: ArgE/DapE family deacylase [Mesorhizobium sp.]